MHNDISAQLCWNGLLYEQDLTAPNTNATPGVYYTPDDVKVWLPGSLGGPFLSGKLLGMHSPSLDHIHLSTTMQLRVAAEPTCSRPAWWC